MTQDSILVWVRLVRIECMLDFEGGWGKLDAAVRREGRERYKEHELEGWI